MILHNSYLFTKEEIDALAFSEQSTLTILNKLKKELILEGLKIYLGDDFNPHNTKTKEVPSKDLEVDELTIMFDSIVLGKISANVVPDIDGELLELKLKLNKPN